MSSLNISESLREKLEDARDSTARSAAEYVEEQTEDNWNDLVDAVAYWDAVGETALDEHERNAEEDYEDEEDEDDGYHRYSS